MGANFRHRKTGPELRHQHRRGQNSVVGAPVAPAKHVDPVRYQVAHGNGRDLLFAGVLPPAFEGSHGTAEISRPIRNLTRTFDAVNDGPEQTAQAATREPPCCGRFGNKGSINLWRWISQPIEIRRGRRSIAPRILVRLASWRSLTGPRNKP